MTDLQANGEANAEISSNNESDAPQDWKDRENGLFGLFASILVRRIIHTPALRSALVTAVSESTPEVDIERLVENEVDEALASKDIPNDDNIRDLVDDVLSEKNLLETDDLDDKIADWFDQQSFNLSISL